MSAKDDEYFEQVEAETGTTLEPAQRRWYVATREADFSGSEEKMWQEYPSTPKEAFQVSTEGKYYAVQMTAARKAGRIGRVPMVDGVEVNSFWDIGNSDGTAVWFHQQVRSEEHMSELQSLMRISYAVFCLKKKQEKNKQ